jgi:hypothetical protein
MLLYDTSQLLEHSLRCGFGCCIRPLASSAISSIGFSIHSWIVDTCLLLLLDLELKQLGELVDDLECLLLLPVFSIRCGLLELALLLVLLLLYVVVVLMLDRLLVLRLGLILEGCLVR